MTDSEPSLALRSVGDRRPHTFVLSPGNHRIGSLQDNEIVLAEPGVSRRHARLRVTPDEVVLDDLASKNGTFVNGEPVESHHVGIGDRLRFGPRTFVLEPLSDADADLAIQLPDTPSGAGSTSRSRPQTPTVHYDELEPDAAWNLSFPPGYVVGDSPPMRALYRRLEGVVGGELPILILGETGVGKEWIARIVHDSSRRADGPFVALNCAAIPAELLEAELFGIGERVATGVAGRPGVLRRAHGGSLFLDEIGEMAPPLQAKLLRVLEEDEIQPVGKAPEPVDVRVLAATNQHLERRMEAGEFRRDLYFRLAGCVVRVPSLRERTDDIPALVGRFLQRAAAAAGKPIRGITRGALEALSQRSWPGNVRELEHEVERLVQACAPRSTLTSDLIESAPATAELPEPHGHSPTPMGRGLDPSRWESLNLEAVERDVIAEALRRAEGNKTRAAEMLGLSRRALSRRIEHYGLE